MASVVIYQLQKRKGLRGRGSNELHGKTIGVRVQVGGQRKRTNKGSKCFKGMPQQKLFSYCSDD